MHENASENIVSEMAVILIREDGTWRHKIRSIQVHVMYCFQVALSQEIVLYIFISKLDHLSFQSCPGI